MTSSPTGRLVELSMSNRSSYMCIDKQSYEILIKEREDMGFIEDLNYDAMSNEEKEQYWKRKSAEARSRLNMNSYTNGKPTPQKPALNTQVLMSLDAYENSLTPGTQEYTDKQKKLSNTLDNLHSAVTKISVASQAELPKSEEFQLEVGKKYVCRNMSQIKHVEIIYKMNVGKLDPYHYISVTTRTDGLQQLSSYTKNGRYSTMGGMEQYDLVAEYVDPDMTPVPNPCTGPCCVDPDTGRNYSGDITPKVDPRWRYSLDWWISNTTKTTAAGKCDCGAVHTSFQDRHSEWCSAYVDGDDFKWK